MDGNQPSPWFRTDSMLYIIQRHEETIAILTIPGSGVPSFLGAPKILQTTKARVFIIYNEIYNSGTITSLHLTPHNNKLDQETQRINSRIIMMT